jgi:hypothetical protein
MRLNPASPGDTAAENKMHLPMRPDPLSTGDTVTGAIKIVAGCG